MTATGIGAGLLAVGVCLLALGANVSAILLGAVGLALVLADWRRP